MPHPFARLAIPALLALAAARPLPGQVVDSTLLRPTDVTVTITGDRNYDGVYQSHAISRVCGKLDLMMPHRVNSFVVEFPDDEPNLEVRSLAFSADTLPADSTTSSFYLSVIVRTATGGSPPAYVVRANEPKYGEPGRAQRIKTAGTDRLVLDGIASTGRKVKVEATVVCHPIP